MTSRNDHSRALTRFDCCQRDATLGHSCTRTDYQAVVIVSASLTPDSSRWPNFYELHRSILVDDARALEHRRAPARAVDRARHVTPSGAVTTSTAAINFYRRLFIFDQCL